MSYQKRWEGGVTLEPTGETEIRGLEHQQVGILGKVFTLVAGPSGCRLGIFGKVEQGLTFLTGELEGCK